MALKPCRECGEDVSTDADSCPNCGVGHPTKGTLSRLLTTSRGKRGGCGKGCGTAFLLFVGIGVVGSVFSPDSDTPEGTSSTTASSAVQYVHNATNVRANRSTESEIVAKLYPGDSVVVDKPGQGWMRVHDPDAGTTGPNSALGYVYAPLLESNPPRRTDGSDATGAADTQQPAQRCSPNIGTIVRIRSGARGRVSVARTEETLDKLTDAVAAGDKLGYKRLVQSNRVFRVKSGTQARILDVGGFLLATAKKVRILEGAFRGEAGWIPSEWADC